MFCLNCKIIILYKTEKVQQLWLTYNANVLTGETDATEKAWLTPFTDPIEAPAKAINSVIVIPKGFD